MSDTYIRLSVVMFLEFAVWGAWAPVLAARLLGPLKMSGKQTGWVYGTLPLASIVAPLVAGQIADQWLSAEYLFAVLHLVGGLLLFAAARQTKFVPLFVTMLLYACCYAGTLPLVNKLLFASIHDLGTQGMVFLWAPVSWALVGYALTGWRQLKGEGDGSDGLILGGAMAILAAISGLFAPHTPPAGSTGLAIVGAFSLLSDPTFLLFLVVSLVVAGLMQFYFMGTAQFLMDLGMSGRYVPAAMAIAQAAQAVVTFFLMGACIGHLGFQRTLVVGAAAWLVMYLLYILTTSKPLLVAAQALHGTAYVLFVIVGQIFANEFAPAGIQGSVQALVFAATTGVGLFVCTQLAGIVMDRFSVNGKFVWVKIWSVPLVLTLAGIVVLIVGVSGTVGVSRIAAQVDADRDGRITSVEIDKSPEAGFRSGAFSFNRVALKAAFDQGVKDGGVAIKDFAGLLKQSADQPQGKK
jgi:MFS family permease